MTGIPVRVTVLDTWEEFGFYFSPDTPMREIKERALDAARITRSPDAYKIKFRGAEIPEADVARDVGLVPNAALIVLPRRRTPVR